MYYWRKLGVVLALSWHSIGVNLALKWRLVGTFLGCSRFIKNLSNFSLQFILARNVQHEHEGISKLLQEI
jgi:hypothetical protein